MLAVVAFHAFPKDLSGGFVGVDVFFVISGYLISSIIFRQLAAGRFTLLDFYARRTRRILPALSIVLAASLAFGFIALLPDEFATLGKQAFAAAAFLANFALWRDSGYFSPSAELQPLLHLWSLGIEEQFYLLWPVLLIVAWKRGWNIVWITALMTVASFALNLYLVDESPSADYYFPFTRFWELGLGCLLAARERGASHESAPLQMFLRQLPIVGVALIAIGAILFDSQTAFPGTAALVPTLGAACIIAAPRDAWVSRTILASRVLVYIGLISYPLYLWHWPILSFATILHSGTPEPSARAVGMLFAVVLAVLTYHWVELPIRSMPRLRVSGGLVGTIAAIGAVSLVVFLQSGFPGRFATDLSAIREPRRLDRGCADAVPGVRRFNYCRRVGKEAPAVVFLGDSQAQAVFEGTVAALHRSQSMMLLGRGGCPPGLDVTKTSLTVYNSSSERQQCNLAWREFADFVRATHPKTVVLVGAASRFFNTGHDTRSSRYLKLDQAAFAVALDKLVADLQQSTQVVYMLEIPIYDTPPRCFLRPMRLPGDTCEARLARDAFEADRAGYVASVREVQARHSGLVIFDPARSLCDADRCSEMDSRGELLYRDNMHLSSEGGTRLAENSGLARFIASVQAESGAG